jgi:hypothetical protein
MPKGRGVDNMIDTTKQLSKFVMIIIGAADTIKKES